MKEVAYFLHALDNDVIAAGLVGELTEPMKTEMFLDHLKKTMEVAVIKHTSLIHSHISKVALCGGAGSFSTSAAIKSGAQLFISADFKYHEFFDTEERIIIADIGHYESEKYTIDLLIELISNNFTNFALHYKTEYQSRFLPLTTTRIKYGKQRINDSGTTCSIIPSAKKSF